jgi:hypothetical protein
MTWLMVPQADDHTAGISYVQITNDNDAGLYSSGTQPGTLGFYAVWDFGVLNYLSSDERLKENITPTTYGLDAVNALNPVTFNWKKDGEFDVGLIAQEVQEVLPTAVGYAHEDAEYLSLRDGPIISALVKAVQELSAEVNILKGMIQ